MPRDASTALKRLVMATYAENPLELIRPAVAIALLWAASAWAQVGRQPAMPVAPVQAVSTELSETPTGQYENKVGAAVTTGTPGEVHREGLGIIRGLTLKLSTGVGYDENVFRTESNTQSDFFLNIRPGAYLDGGFGKHIYRLGYEGDYAAYRDFSTEDFDDHRVFGNLGLDLTRKVDVNLGGQVWLGHDPRGAPGSRIINPLDLDTWREQELKAELVLGREITRAQVTPWIQYTGLRYTNNNQSGRDFDRMDYRARGRWRFTPRFYGLVEGGFATVDHLDKSNNLDRTESGVLVGFGWQASAKTSGDVLVGVLNRDFDDPSRGSSSDLDWDARVHWAPKPHSRFTAYTFRRSQETPSAPSGTFLSDTIGGRWRHAFTERWELDTGIEYTRADFETGREDDYLRFDMGLVYALTRWLDAAAIYRYDTRRSNLPGINYDDHMALFELRVQVDKRLSR
jgi:hypothetical protein